MKFVLDDGALMPVRMHEDDAGIDLITPVDFVIMPRSYVNVNLGVHVAIPEGYYGKMESRSGMMAKGVTTMGGVIDPNYRGAIRVCLYNHNDYEMRYYKGDRITQMVIMPFMAEPIEAVNEIDETVRGENGFGSTGA